MSASSHLVIKNIKSNSEEKILLSDMWLNSAVSLGSYNDLYSFVILEGIPYDRDTDNISEFWLYIVDNKNNTVCSQFKFSNPATGMAIVEEEVIV